MNTDLPPQYDPQSVEKAIYQRWLDAGVFHAVPDARAPEKRFSVVIPPPNVTGALHLGHAINGTIQDVLTRYHRMKGDNTLWMPGIDHAGIATQAVVEKTIFEKEKKSRHDLGREELVRRIWEWKEQFGTRILDQLASIGCSCDWDRTRFTLDETCAKAVREAFFKMFKDGLIFRGKRLVNWDAHLQTAVADDEIYHEEVKGQMTSIRYPVASEAQTLPDGRVSDQEFLIVATTRPETMLGDTAVAVHPDDPRYKHLIGQHVILPLVGRKIPIIADGLLVDPAFGTGVVKVTPAHDPNDYATGLRHNLEQINLLTPDGKVNENGQGEFRGKKYSYTGLKFATKARDAVLKDLEELGLIADKKPHVHQVGHSDRSKTPIEPYLSDQWFVRMGDLSETRPSGSVVPSETRPSGSVIRASPPAAPETLPHGRVSDQAVPQRHSDAIAYFITFRTYATWLHGIEGSVDPEHNIPGSPFVPPDPAILQRDLANLSEPPVQLTLEQRQNILRTLQEVAAFRGWTLHALNVLSTHVHAVVSGNHAPERMMNDFKSYATRRMVENSLLPPESKIWARHGSTRYLWKAKDVQAAIDYTLHQQGENLPGTFSEARPSGSVPHSETRPSGSVPHAPHPSAQQVLAGQTLPNGRVSDGISLADGTRAPGLAQAAIDAVISRRVKITPERYAKGYVDWLSQKRDWCISRQLWWGHRIPVWTKTDKKYWTWGEIIEVGPHWADPVLDAKLERWANLYAYHAEGEGQEFDSEVTWKTYICLRADDAELEQILTDKGFVRDPDVLDTWFSSALWPLSTMGWPNSQATSETRPSGSVSPSDTHPHHTLPDGRVSDGMRPEPELLPYFYPTSVLSTAREILTLWVARMVIFGLYCHGDVPFRDVYIHAVIQDGEGRPMKKSLGNGVDPVEIVASHGADALRFTLASMATETQDIRMPVVKDAKTGVNTSPKFDIGRNFANKIWNAARYVLTNVDEEALRHKGTEALRGEGIPANAPAPLSASVPDCLSASPLPLEDRWILSRLNATIAAAETAINAYRFADLAQSLYQFFWTDFCDWYLEISKARIKAGDAAVQSILLHCLETSLKLLHPLMPFITEEIWSKLPGRASMLINAPWPMPALLANWSSSIPNNMGFSFADAQVESQLTLIQSITTAIREIQNRYPAAKGKDAILQPRDAATQSIIETSRSIIEPLAGIRIAENSPAAQKPENAATAVLPEVQIFIGGVIDKAAETAKLAKRREELGKFIAGGKSKLANESFTAKAPPAVVQGLRDQLAKQEEELAAIEKNLAELAA